MVVTDGERAHGRYYQDVSCLAKERVAAGLDQDFTPGHKDEPDERNAGRGNLIGPVTADTAKSLGIEPDIIAKEYTIDGLVEAICK